MLIKYPINLKLNCIFKKINIEKISDKWEIVGLKSFKLIVLIIIIKLLKIKIKKLLKKMESIQSDLLIFYLSVVKIKFYFVYLYEINVFIY